MAYNSNSPVIATEVKQSLEIASALWALAMTLLNQLSRAVVDGVEQVAESSVGLAPIDHRKTDQDDLPFATRNIYDSTLDNQFILSGQPSAE
jgi:hypothetical protein